MFRFKTNVLQIIPPVPHGGDDGGHGVPRVDAPVALIHHLGHGVTIGD